jgi:hypothetical protein
MRFFAITTLLFTTLATANPAPAAHPETGVAPANLAQLEEALASRDPAAQPEVVPEIVARTAEIQLERRKKPKSSNNKGNSTNSSATSITPSRALQLGALGLGVYEVVQLWG